MSWKQLQIETVYQPATPEEVQALAVEVFGSIEGDSAIASIIRLIRIVADSPDAAERDCLATRIADHIYGLTTDHSTARDTFIAMNLPPARPVVHC